jgi:hypothetical protein
VNQAIRKAFNCAYTIIILVIPFSLVCSLLNYLGVIQNVAFLFSPFGSALMLPPGIAIAMASGCFFNLYAGIAVAETLDLTASQWTIFGIFLAVCHSIPLEGAVLKKVGIPFTWHCLTRLFCGFGSAWAFSRLIYANEVSSLSFSIPSKDLNLVPKVTKSFISFLFESLGDSLTLTVKIITLVVSLILLFELLKSQKMVAKFLDKNPYFSSLLVGGLLGITYGAGILLKDIKNVSKLQRVLLLSFLMLAHGLIEETLLFSFFGASPLPILFIRVGLGSLAVILMYLFARKLPSTTFTIKEKQNV